MATYNGEQARCWVLTYKEGVLSSLAHDLKLRVTSLSVTVDDETREIRAEFDARSLRVETVMKKGVPAPGVLGPDDFRKIEGTVVDEVLHARRHPSITFVSTRVQDDGARIAIEGDLTLHGVTRPLTLQARREGGYVTATVELHQPDFGITPYRAMMGALRIQPVVHVQIQVPDRAST